MGLTPAPVYAWFLAWIALAPLWVLVRQEPVPAVSTDAEPSRSRNFFRSKLLYGLLWGMGYHGCALFWITGIHPMTWMGVPWLASLTIAVFCWIFITLWGAAIAVAWAGLFSRLCCLPASAVPLPVWLRVLLGTALWCGLEAVWSWGPLYWSTLPYTQSPHNLLILHLGQISGPLLVSGAIVAVNGLLAEAWIQWRKQQTGVKSLLASLGVLLVTLHGMGYWLYSRPIETPAAAALRVGIIQGNVPNAIKLYEEGWRRAIAGYTEGYEALAAQGVEVVLTPETALPTIWVGANRDRASFYQAILRRGVPAWLGAFGQEGRKLTNSLFTVGENGETLNEYRKVKLVPLGEYIPFEDFLGTVLNRLSPLDADLLAGRPDQIVDTPFGRMIAAICYESAFPEHFRYQAAAGGQMIITASNDAHYSAAMPAQHHAQDLMRAIETDRWAARATNTGYSAIVDPHGRTLWISDLNTYAIHAATLYRRSTQTLYVRWGDWVTPLLLGIALAGWGLHRLKRRQ